MVHDEIMQDTISGTGRCMSLKIESYVVGIQCFIPNGRWSYHEICDRGISQPGREGMKADPAGFTPCDCTGADLALQQERR